MIDQNKRVADITRISQQSMAKFRELNDLFTIHALPIFSHVSGITPSALPGMIQYSYGLGMNYLSAPLDVWERSWSRLWAPNAGPAPMMSLACALYDSPLQGDAVKAEWVMQGTITWNQGPKGANSYTWGERVIIGVSSWNYLEIAGGFEDTTTVMFSDRDFKNKIARIVRNLVGNTHWRYVVLHT